MKIEFCFYLLFGIFLPALLISLGVYNYIPKTFATITALLLFFGSLIILIGMNGKR